MHFYRTIRFDDDINPWWHATLSEAHANAKLVSFPELRIELFDVETDKAGILGLLNGDDGTENADGPMRTWCLTPRKGLKEVPNGE